MENEKNTLDVQVLETSKNVRDGQLKCPGCGASELVPNPKTGKLRCNYCYTEFAGEKILENDISSLKGKTIGSGATNIKNVESEVITLKCGGCGAEVVIDMTDAPHARCHWCRSYLSINSKMENGSIPDVVLPFKLTKEEAQNNINAFVKKRGFFANPTFKKEFTTDNIMGVYFPYMLVDANCHAKFTGVGEHLIRRYTVKHGDSTDTYYDADEYEVSREFDLVVDDLSVESNSKRADKTDNSVTNNIINSIMPFDTENCIEYNSNYLIGYTSERRDVNVDDLDSKVNTQITDIARHSINDDLKFYDRGIRWEGGYVDVKGTQWIAAYLPVWLYSYHEKKGNKDILHYVAVNARTRETMGSVPINMPLLLGVSAIIEIICVILGFMIAGADDDGAIFLILSLFGGFIFYFLMYAKYRNKDARHKYETETKNNITNIVRSDTFVKHNNGQSNSRIKGMNNLDVKGDK